MKALYVTALALLTALIFHQVRKRADPVAVSPRAVQASADDPKKNVAFFNENVVPLEIHNRLRNQEAAGRALSRVADRIETYRAGIQPFVRDITGWGTRLKVLWHLPADSFMEGHKIPDMIRAKFDEHLFSEATLKKDLEEVFEALQSDFEANQLRLIAEARAVAEGSGRRIDFPDVDSFSALVRKRLVDFAEARAKDSALNGVITFVTATAVSIGAEQLVIRLVAASGTSAAFGGVAVGGATAGGAGGGAAAGSAAGPAGAIAGFMAGLVIGIAVDWWMTEDFQVKTTEELNRQLDTLRDTLIHGVKNDKDQGLQNVLSEFTSVVDQAQDEQLRSIFSVPPNPVLP